MQPENNWIYNLMWSDPIEDGKTHDPAVSASATRSGRRRCVPRPKAIRWRLLGRAANDRFGRSASPRRKSVARSDKPVHFKTLLPKVPTAPTSSRSMRSHAQSAFRPGSAAANTSRKGPVLGASMTAMLEALSLTPYPGIGEELKTK